jgi:hypothetical protein
VLVCRVTKEFMESWCFLFAFATRYQRRTMFAAHMVIIPVPSFFIYGFTHRTNYFKVQLVFFERNLNLFSQGTNGSSVQYRIGLLCLTIFPKTAKIRIEGPFKITW